MELLELYIRFQFKPINEDECINTKYIEQNNVWIRVYKEACLLGIDFVSEAGYEWAWFERNPEIFKMIRTNDKTIAKRIAKHKLSEIAFLAKEILSGNVIILSAEKVFQT